MTIFFQILRPNPTQYLNLTTTLLTINKQQIRSLLRQKLLIKKRADKLLFFLNCNLNAM